MTYAFCRFFAFVYCYVYMYIICLSTVDITIDSWLTEKYSQYDKTCEVPQLNCAQPFIHMNVCSCIHINTHMNDHSCMRFSHR